MKHISYASSTIFFLILLFAIWEGYKAIHPDFYAIGMVLFWSVAIALPIFFAIKLIAMYKIDVMGVKPAPRARRMSTPRTTTRRVDGPQN